MKIKKHLAIALVFVAVLAIAAASQLSSSNEKFEKYALNKVNDKITLEEKQECVTIRYNKTVPVFGNVTKTSYTYGTCFNSTNQTYYQCVNSTAQYQSYEVVNEAIQESSRDECESKNSFIISVNRNNELVKKEVDFSKYGVCVQQEENGCAAIL